MQSVVLIIAVSVESKVRPRVIGDLVKIRDLLSCDKGANLQKVLFHHREVRDVKGGESGVRAPLSCL